MSERAHKKHCFTHKANYNLIKNEDVTKTFSGLHPYQSYSLCEYFNAAVLKIFPVLFNYKGLTIFSYKFYIYNKTNVYPS